MKCEKTWHLNGWMDEWMDLERGSSEGLGRVDVHVCLYVDGGVHLFVRSFFFCDGDVRKSERGIYVGRIEFGGLDSRGFLRS